MKDKVAKWFKGLSTGAKIAVVLSSAFWALVGAGMVSAAVGPHTPTPPPKPPVVTTPVEKPGPKIEKKEVVDQSDVGFSVKNQDDPNADKGTTKTIQEGALGVKTVKYEVTYTDGVETARRVTSDEVTKQPVDKIVAVGTYVAPAPEPPAPTGCYPLSNGGNCYSAGQYCRNSDHGATGVAGNGARIVCADNNGWRWEPY